MRQWEGFLSNIRFSGGGFFYCIFFVGLTENENKLGRKSVRWINLVWNIRKQFQRSRYCRLTSYFEECSVFGEVGNVSEWKNSKRKSFVNFWTNRASGVNRNDKQTLNSFNDASPSLIAFDVLPQRSFVF